jgi:5-methylcytosine-specific restriction enzyme subunit McrC
MIDTITLKEYDQLHIRDKRDAARNVISKADALALQSVIMDDEPVFKWGYKKLVAQHWVGTISLKDLNIEILPKLYGHVSTEELRNVLMRMLTISHQGPSVREMPGMVRLQQNSLIEMLIDTFLNQLDVYVKEGLQHSYKKIDKNINTVKGRILFGKQFSRNVLDPTKFWCRFSKFTADNELNQFMKLCLLQMKLVSKDNHNKRHIDYLLPFFEEITTVTKEKVLAKPVVFNSTNQRAESAYRYGLLFLNNIFSTLSAGNTSISMMLFDMNDLYELFIYRVLRMIHGNKVLYQKRGNYLLERHSDHKKYIGLRPDITIKKDSGLIDIVDTKWKIPKSFAKESDAYQMNAYSSSIKGVQRVILLYPLVQKERIVDDYDFMDLNGKKRPLCIRTVDLMKMMNWKDFINEVKGVLV